MYDLSVWAFQGRYFLIGNFVTWYRVVKKSARVIGFNQKQKIIY